MYRCFVGPQALIEPLWAPITASTMHCYTQLSAMDMAARRPAINTRGFILIICVCVPRGSAPCVSFVTRVCYVVSPVCNMSSVHTPQPQGFCEKSDSKRAREQTVITSPLNATRFQQHQDVTPLCPVCLVRGLCQRRRRPCVQRVFRPHARKLAVCSQLTQPKLSTRPSKHTRHHNNVVATRVSCLRAPKGSPRVKTTNVGYRALHSPPPRM
jgi:hypothetical protein